MLVARNRRSHIVFAKWAQERTSEQLATPFKVICSQGNSASCSTLSQGCSLQSPQVFHASISAPGLGNQLVHSFPRHCQDFQAANHTRADARQSIAENCRGALAQLWPFIGVEALPRSLLKPMLLQLLCLWQSSHVGDGYVFVRRPVP